MTTSTSRLLILDDRRKDAEWLCQRMKALDLFRGDTIYLESENKPPLEKVQNASVVVAHTRKLAEWISGNLKFDLIISDLMLFDPADVKRADEKYPENYFLGLPLKDRREQITNPSGLEFIEFLRSGKAASKGTPAEVSIIAMTFFWRHPRFQFQDRYLERISLKDPPIAYLPKYYWEGSQAIREKGDAALLVLIDILGDQNHKRSKILIRMVYDSVALDLLIHQTRFDVDDALRNLRSSYDRPSRSLIEFELIFRFQNMKAPDVSEDQFHYVMQKLKSSDGDYEANVEVNFDKIPQGVPKANAGARTQRRLTKSGEKVLLTIPSKGKKTTTDAQVRQFAICWALALYTFPLPKHPHCLDGKHLVELISPYVGFVDEKDIKSDIRIIRQSLQASLTAHLSDFISAERHLLVMEGHDGYYLNGTYRCEGWKRS